MPAFIEAVNANGEKQMIPDTWLEEGSPFADQFRLAPSDRQRAERTPEPSDNWTIAQLRDEAAVRGVDLTGLAKKPDLVAAFTAAPDVDASTDA